MMSRGMLWLCLLALAAGGLGCDGSVDVAGLHKRPYTLPNVFDQTDNGLSINGLVTNGLRMNGLRMNGLRMNGLRMNGLVLNGTLSLNGLDEADSYNLMTYLVGCALPAGHQVTIYGVGTFGYAPYMIVYTWGGALGLAPELESGPLTNTGERAVSSCLLAHANSAGKHIVISVRGDGIPVTNTELQSYTYPDGTFWGNLFAEPAELSACTPDGLTASDATVLQGMGRDCDIPNPVSGLSPCGIDIRGSCSAVCDLATTNADGSYTDCLSEVPPISVFLPPLGSPPPDLPPSGGPLPAPTGL
jgi:hypothetical protein